LVAGEVSILKRLVGDSFAITVKELKQLGRDPVSLILTFMFPILLIGIFIVIVAAFSAPSFNIPVAVADLDGSPASKVLVDKMATSSIIRVMEFVPTEEQALSRVEAGDVLGAVVIPNGFGAALATGKAFVIIQTDNSKITAPTLIQAAVNRDAQDLVSTSGAQFGVKQATVNVIVRPMSGRPPSGDPILPGFLGMITILGAFDDIVNAITRERERGTFPRLLLSPVNIFSIYTGKMFATVILTALRTSLMLMIFAMMGLVVHGNLLLVYLTTSLIAVFTLSLGLVMSARIRGSSTLTVLEIAMTFPLFSLAGTFNSPLLLASGGKAIAYSLPWTYGNDALRRVIYSGLGLNAISGDLTILLVSSFILLPIAILLSKRTM
jgi:ABC-type multidrug transport system permease subunit